MAARLDLSLNLQRRDAVRPPADRSPSEHWLCVTVNESSRERTRNDRVAAIFRPRDPWVLVSLWFYGLALDIR